LKEKRKSLSRDEYAFLIFDGFILQTVKVPFSKTWTVQTSMGSYTCDDSPNGFIVARGILLEMFTNPNKINARISVIVPRNGKMLIYKMEKIITNTDILRPEKPELTNIDVRFESNYILNLLISDGIIIFFLIAMIIIPTTFHICNYLYILFPRFIFISFIVICCLAILVVLFHFSINIYVHNNIISLRFLGIRISVLIAAIFALLLLNDNKKLFF
jgi:hypothetical protein